MAKQIYIKIITCKFCDKKIEVPVKPRNNHGFVKRRCPLCNKQWRVDYSKSLLPFDV